MFEAFITLFKNAEVIYFIIISMATIMLICEIFIPSFGVVGISGLMLASCGITIRCLEKGLTALEIVMYIIYTCLLIGLIVLLVKLVYKALKKQRKEKVKLKDGAVVVLTNEGNPDYNFLLNKEGVVLTDLKPSGKAQIEGEIYDVCSSKEYIYHDNKIKVIKIEDTRIIVDKIS